MSIKEIDNKISMKAALRQSFGDVIYACDKLSEELFLAPRASGKWSPGEIIGHLILSTKPINKALTAPKMLLKATYGKVKRQKYSYKEVKDRYQVALSEAKAPPSFVYNNVSEKGKEGMIERFSKELENLNQNIDKWKEDDLLSYQLPHPVLGKLSIKEMIYFTIIHTDHHSKQIESVLSN